jgi:hypothetical protein
LPSPLDYLHQLGANKWGGPVDVGCLYYPGAYLDTGPLELLLRSRSASASEPFDSFATAIYVDINITEVLIQRLVDRIRRIFNISTVIPFLLLPKNFGGLSAQDFYPQPDDPFFKSELNYANHYQPDLEGFFGIKILFPEIGFALIYLKAEGIQAYRTLLKAKITPNIVVLQDHGVFGFQHATFYRGSLLNKAAKPLPQYLYIDETGDPWDGYERVSTSYVDRGQDHQHARCLYVRKSSVNKAVQKMNQLP